MRGANAVELRHCQLPLIGAAFAKDDVPLPKAQLAPDDIAPLPPAPDVQALRIYMLQPHMNILLRILRFRPVTDALRKITKGHALPAFAVKQKERGPCGIGQ